MSDQIEPTVGSHAIEFSLSASTGAQISLSNYLTRKNVYLFFVREYN